MHNHYLTTKQNTDTHTHTSVAICNKEYRFERIHQHPCQQQTAAAVYTEEGEEADV